MNRRKLTALAATGAIASTVAITASPAYAVPRTFVVTLLGGGQVTVTVDVPAGTPADQITFPGIDLPVVAVTEVTAAPSPTTTSTPDAGTPTPGFTPTPGTTPQSGDSPQGVPGPGGQQQSSQETALRRPTGEQGVVPDLATALEQQGADRERRDPDPANPGRNTDGSPTPENPSFTLATPGAAPIGVPNFFIDKFRIPPFLLPIYQAAGIQYGVRWEILAAINEIETDYGRNLNVSSAGALGWMQFMPATWRAYGVDANKDGIKDPYNPVDAIFAAARYLKAANIDVDLRAGIWAYNHADWYVDMVLLRARMIGGLPADFVGSLTGLTQGRFPVDAEARYAGAVPLQGRRVATGNAANVVESVEDRDYIDIFADAGSPVVAVNDGRITGLGENATDGRWIRLRDVYGNTFTYTHLGKVAETYPLARERSVSEAKIARELDLPAADEEPAEPASRTRRDAAARKERRAADPAPAAPAPVIVAKDRLFANPRRPNAAAAGGDLQVAQAEYEPAADAALRLNREDYVPVRMHKGARVIAGTVLGRIGKTSETVAPHVRFAIKPSGQSTPDIDPKPILDGWKLLETTALYRAAGKNPFVGPDAQQPTIGQILLMSKAALQEHVLANPRIDIYSCGREDIRLGLIDRRVLATLEFLAASGLKPSVSSLRCGHSYYTASGNVSAHSSGNAVDIPAVNGIPILGNQGAGSITEMTIERLLTLQGTMEPNQIISLMTFEGRPNTLSLPDHHDHIHVGFQPLYGSNDLADRRATAVLKPDQWIKLIDRLGEIDNPTVRTSPSKFALKVEPRPGSSAD
jgi:hypothetical protein